MTAIPLSGSSRTRRTTTVRQSRSKPAVVGGLVAGIVIAIALDTIVAAITHGAGASRAFSPLKLQSYGALTTFGILAAAVGWNLIRTKASDPRKMLRWLVPVVLLITFVPDLLIGALGTMAGESWGAVSGPMAMHAIVAVTAVLTFLAVLPLKLAER